MLGRAAGELNEQGYLIKVQARFQVVETDYEFRDWLKNNADAIFLMATEAMTIDDMDTRVQELSQSEWIV